MASADSIRKVTPNLSRGKSYLPGNGSGGKIPGPGVASTPKPSPAANSGKSLKSSFPSAVVNLPTCGPKTGR